MLQECCSFQRNTAREVAALRQLKYSLESASGEKESDVRPRHAREKAARCIHMKARQLRAHPTSISKRTQHHTIEIAKKN